MKITTNNKYRKFRKSFWPDTYFKPIQITPRYVLGTIYSAEDDHPTMDAQFPLTDDWCEYVSAQDTINSLWIEKKHAE